MSLGGSALLTGTLLTAGSCTATLFASVVEECLKTYHRSELFESLSERRREQFETLLRREADHLLVARLGRLVSHAIAYFGVLILMSADGGAYTLSDALWALGMTIGLGILLAGIIPAVWASNWAEPTLRRLLPFFAAVSLPLIPWVMLVNALERGVARVAGEEPTETAEQEFTDNIADHLDEATRDGVIGKGEREMIDSIIDFSGDTARDVMTPRTEMICVDVADTVDRAMEIAQGHGHSRLPVFEGNRDTIVGMFNVRDALLYWKSRSETPMRVKEVLRPVLFVPESKSLAALLNELRQSNAHLAIVLDEFGGTSGLVTLEDVLEEIVGDIRDEFDQNEDRIHPPDKPAADGREAVVDARTKIDDFNKSYQVDLPESANYTSIAGLISSRIGRIPDPGEAIEIDGVTFTVMEATERAIKRVRVSKPVPVVEATD
jgi:CBS domain containing-hemolysin-like protein